MKRGRRRESGKREVGKEVDSPRARFRSQNPSPIRARQGYVRVRKKKNRARLSLYFHLVSPRIESVAGIEQRRAFSLSLSLFHFVFSFRRMFTGARVHCASADLFSARRPSIRRVARLFRATTTNAKNAPLPRLDSSSSSSSSSSAAKLAHFGFFNAETGCCGFLGRFFFAEKIGERDAIRIMFKRSLVS